MNSALRRCVLLPCLLALACSHRSTEFPRLRDARFGLLGGWDVAQAAVVGDVVNVRFMGRQKVPLEDLEPKGRPVTIEWIYWCTGDLRWDILAKGVAPNQGLRYAWHQDEPGCDPHKFDHGFSEPVRVWMVREEGGYLRPPTDTFGEPYFVFRSPQPINAGGNVQVQIGRLLLSPSAVAHSISAYSTGVWERMSMACELLAETECREGIRRLTTLGDLDLRERACHFLEMTFREKCPPGAGK